jgi:hypothetical protein
LANIYYGTVNNTLFGPRLNFSNFREDRRIPNGITRKYQSDASLCNLFRGGTEGLSEILCS